MSLKLIIKRSLLHAQQALYEIEVGMANRSFYSHCSFAFGRFLGEDVAFERFLKGDFSGAGYFKPFLGTGICFNLGHFSPIYLFYPAGVPLRRTLGEPCGQ